MVMAMDCGAGGPEFKPRRFLNIFDKLIALEHLRLAITHD